MASASAQQLFGAAEQAYLTGRLVEARALLSRLELLNQPAVHHLRAMVEQNLGNLAAARRHFERAATLAPRDPQLWNNFGNLLDRCGDQKASLDAYNRALELSPRFADALFNRALLLGRMGRLDEARGGFQAAVARNPSNPAYWNGLANLERAAGDLTAAACAYDRALGVRPQDPLATIGRARVALERDEPDVRDRYQAARRVAPDNPELLIDQAEARLVHGDRAALDDLAADVVSRPDWTSGQVALARMRWEQGQKEDFAQHIEALLAASPMRDELWRAYAQLLSACKLPEKVAEVAARARHALGNDPQLALTEAIAAGQSGQIERADALFASLPARLPKRAINESVHRIRKHDYDRALTLAELALAEDRWDVATWTIVELLYRKLGDPRSEWLSGQAGLIEVMDLSIDTADFAAADALLLRLHQASIEAVGQSVRGGSQTRWNLFDRAEPALARLRTAIERGVATYADRLPPRDVKHPLLRRRNEPMRIIASWSVRLLGAGYHEPHFHPKGLLSSACYFRVPARETGSHDGWLEIGRPPADLLMRLDPIETIEPEPGRLALFPSYLFHGTRPFHSGERMTVAFDVAAT